MDGFRINFQLQELDKIMPFGEEPHLRLHWFGLTDGLLWVDVGSQTIYEYNDAAKKYFGHSARYNDYPIARFLEDFFCTFRFVGESIPRALYSALDQFDSNMEKWMSCYVEEKDEIWHSFYDEYYALYKWCECRSFDSGHLTGGPKIGCFRCEEKIKIIWKSDFRFDDGSRIWTAPEGGFEMAYEPFILSVKSFFDAFSAAMDQQIENAVAKRWENIFLDKQELVRENNQRKSIFLKDISFLENTCEHTDWDSIMRLYSKMEEEIAGRR